MVNLPNMNFFGKQETQEAVKARNEERAKEDLKAWQRKLKKEQRDMDRQIMKIRREQDKIKKEIKGYAAKNEIGAVKTLAKEVSIIDLLRKKWRARC